MKDSEIVFYIPNSKLQFVFTYILINIIAFLPFIILFPLYKMGYPTINVFWFILLGILLMPVFKYIAKSTLLPTFGSKNTLIITKEYIEIVTETTSQKFLLSENILINGYEEYEIGLIPTIQIKHQMQIIITLPSNYVLPSSYKSFNNLYKQFAN